MAQRGLTRRERLLLAAQERGQKRVIVGNALTSFFQSLPGNRPLQVAVAFPLIELAGLAVKKMNGSSKIADWVVDGAATGLTAGMVGYLLNSDGGVSTAYDVPDVEAPRVSDVFGSGGPDGAFPFIPVPVGRPVRPPPGEPVPGPVGAPASTPIESPARAPAPAPAPVPSPARAPARAPARVPAPSGAPQEVPLPLVGGSPEGRGTGVPGPFFGPEVPVPARARRLSRSESIERAISLTPLPAIGVAGRVAARVVPRAATIASRAAARAARRAVAAAEAASPRGLLRAAAVRAKSAAQRAGRAVGVGGGAAAVASRPGAAARGPDRAASAVASRGPAKTIGVGASARFR